MRPSPSLRLPQVLSRGSKPDLAPYTTDATFVILDFFIQSFITFDVSFSLSCRPLYPSRPINIHWSMNGIILLAHQPQHQHQLLARLHLLAFVLRV